MSSPPWFSIGHTTLEEQRSGCTAIIFDRQVLAAVDVRGGAPGTRETTLLDPGNIGMLDAIVLSGGSAFGLRTADGVMQYLAERGRGFETRAGVVPLVSAAIIFDLGVGDAYHPTVDDGYAASVAAAPTGYGFGAVGAGTGATVAKLTGRPVRSGLGIGHASAVNFSITAVVVLNAVGDIRNPESGEWLAVCDGVAARSTAIQGRSAARPLENTTIGAILVDCALDRKSLARVCISAQAALARCTVPAHTVLDGDTFFAACSSSGSPNTADVLAATALTEVAVEQAVLSIFA